MKRYIKKGLFAILTLGLISTMFNVSIFSQNTEDIADPTRPDVEGLELNKTAKVNGDGTYTLQLEVYSEGEIKVVTKSKPLDIVLVLDQSGSMRWGIERKTEEERVQYKMAYSEVTNFGSELISRHETNYVKRNNQYVPVQFVRPETLYDYGYKVLYVFKDSDNKELVATKEDGSSADPTNTYPSEQFYRKIEPTNEADNYKGTPRIQVLKSAAQQFINNVVADGGDHRIAVVGYAQGEKDGNVATIGFQNTELFVGENQYSQNGQYVDGGALANGGTGIQLAGIDAQYKNAFQSTATAGGVQNLNNSINALSAAGATRADLGMLMANEILAQNSFGDSDREKVVIMFTDGEPTASSTFSDSVANDAINYANQMKKQGVKVFTVGVENTLDVNADPALSTTNNMNKYMQYVSYNFPTATSLTDAGTDGNYLGKKFLSADDEESLMQVFKDINEEIGSSEVTLDSTTELVDYVSDYFDITGETDIKAFTQDYAGKDADGNHLWSEDLVPFTGATIDVDDTNKKISVSGFDYKTEFIASNGGSIRGKRLVVQIKVKAKSGFIGGKNVPTNTEDAGIYSGGPVEYFEVPTVDVPVEFDFTTSNKSMFIGGSVTNMSDIFDCDPATAGIQYKDAKGNVFTLDGVNNAFVDITYTVTDKDGKQLGSYLIPAGSTQFSLVDEAAFNQLVANNEVDVKATLRNKGDITTTALETAKKTNIYVFTPTLTVEDKVIFYGEKVNLADQITGVAYTNVDAKASYPSDVEPTLSYAFNVGDGINYEPNKTAGYSVNVKNGTFDITNYTKVENAVAHQGFDFEIQVVKGELVIEKKIDKQYTPLTENKAEQSFKFKIDYVGEDGTTKTYFQTIQFSANDNETVKTITLKGLRKGTYTVSEVSDWSWRYDEVVGARLDNYNGNGTTAGASENANLKIGDTTKANTGLFTYYGSETGTTINGQDQTFVAKVHFENVRNNLNVIGDVATAINQFVTK